MTSHFRSNIPKLGIWRTRVERVLCREGLFAVQRRVRNRVFQFVSRENSTDILSAEHASMPELRQRQSVDSENQIGIVLGTCNQATAGVQAHSPL